MFGSDGVSERGARTKGAHHQTVCCSQSNRGGCFVVCVMREVICEFNSSTAWQRAEWCECWGWHEVRLQWLRSLRRELLLRLLRDLNLLKDIEGYLLLTRRDGLLSWRELHGNWLNGRGKPLRGETAGRSRLSFRLCVEAIF